MIYIGIDPGLTGAVGVLDGSESVVYDTPIAKEGKRTVYVPKEMDAILRLVKGAANLHKEQVHVFIERVHSMPHQGVASSFNFGIGFGMWLGIIAALNLPVDKVTPQNWKRTMLHGQQKDKDSARIRAIELFPNVSLALKKHHGRADALLIAEFGRRLLSA